MQFDTITHIFILNNLYMTVLGAPKLYLASLKKRESQKNSGLEDLVTENKEYGQDYQEMLCENDKQCLKAGYGYRYTILFLYFTLHVKQSGYFMGG